MTRRHRSAWLTQLASSPRLRAASALLVADSTAAIGFAFALAGGLSALPGGVAAALPWLIGGTAAALGRAACTAAAARLGAAASATARAGLRRRVTVQCLAGAESIETAMSAQVDAVDAMDGYIARFVPARQAASLAPLLVMAAVALASPVCALILAGTLLPFIVLMILAGGAAADQSRAQFTALSRLGGLFAGRLRALPTILVFGAADAEATRLGHAADELRRRTMAVLRVAFISSAGLEFFAALSVALVAVYCGFNLLHLLPFPAPEQLDLPRALFALALAPEFFAPMRRLAAAYHDQQMAETAADRLMALPQPGARRPVTLAVPPRIRFQDATVRYPGEDHAALGPISFDAAPGQITVLLGPSGAGKTTALTLLLGLAPLTAGEVWIDDHALTSLGSLAGAVAWAGQRSVLVPGTIAANIALSNQAGPGPAIAAAAAAVGLPDGRGVDTVLDERGSGLSGGERRRLALARALLNPSTLLLLDEPTAHLDSAAEQDLIAAIQAAARGRTTIIATHSAALAAIADRVVRL